MKLRKRLTRQESKEVTRTRLLEAAETLFIRQGFDSTSVDDISELAGYSRGAFYSNFDDKDQAFLAVIDRRWPSSPKALDDIVQFREWYANQWRLKDFIALQADFSRRALKDRPVRKRLAEFRREELEAVTSLVVRYFGASYTVPAERPETVALALLAVARGLASLAMGVEPEREHIYTEAAALVFDRMTAPQISELGEL